METKDWQKFYQDVLNHLIKTNQEFCFLADGTIICRQDCQNYLELIKTN